MSEEKKDKISKEKEVLNPEELKKPAPGGRGSLKEFERQLEECQRQRAEYLAGWQRARADFLNYKKDEMERIGELVKYANEEWILKILPILDNFELAEKKLSGNLKNEECVKGILQIKTQIQDFLKSQGVEVIKALGDPPSPEATARQRKFDPNFMEAVGEVEIEGVEPGIVVEEIQKGYKINGRLLRPAKVKLSK